MKGSGGARLTALLVVLLAAPPAWSRQCDDLFRESVSSKAAPESAGVLAERSRSRHLLEERASLTSKNAEQKIAASLRALEKHGVDARRIEAAESLFGRIETPPRVQILPSRRSRLNRVASAMLTNYGTRLIYDPALSRDTAAASDFKTRTVWISEVSAFRGVIDSDLMHEIKHIALSFKEAKSQPILGNGQTFKLFTRGPWGSASLSTYDRFLSFQELHTYLQDFNYLLRGARELLEKPDLSERMIREYFTRVQAESLNTILIFSDIQSAVQYLRSETEGRRTSLGFIHARGVIAVHKSKWLRPSLISEYVPRSYYESHLPHDLRTASNEILTTYFSTRNGKSQLHEIAVGYLKTLEIEIANRIAYVEYFSGMPRLFGNDLKTDLRTPEERRAYLAEFISTHMRPVSMEHLPTTTASQATSTSKNQNPPSRETLLNLSEIPERLQQKRIFDFEGSSSEKSAAEIVSYLRAKSSDAIVGRAELDIQKIGGEVSRLTLEWSDLRFEEAFIFAKLADGKYHITRATVTTLQTFELAKNHGDRPGVLEAVRNLHGVSMMRIEARNRARLDEIGIGY